MGMVMVGMMVVGQEMMTKCGGRRVSGRRGCGNGVVVIMMVN